MSVNANQTIDPMIAERKRQIAEWTDTSKWTTYDKLNALTRIGNKGERKAPFGPGIPPDPHMTNVSQAKITRIPINSKLKRSQSSVQVSGVVRHLPKLAEIDKINSSEEDYRLPLVVEKKTGERVIIDGHHRLTGAKLKGYKTFPVRLQQEIGPRDDV